MQRNNRLLATLGILALATGSSMAQQAAPTAASAPLKSSAPTSDEIRAVGVGSKAGASSTFKDLISLQEQLQLKEMRDKLSQGGSGVAMAPVAAPTVTPVAPVVPVAATGVSRLPTPNRAIAPVAPAASSQQTTAEQRDADQRSAARAMVGGVRWIRSIAVGGITRADLNTGTYVRTVKEGEQINGWTVARIKATGVTLERSFGNGVDTIVVPSAIDMAERSVQPSGMNRPPALPIIPKPDSTTLFTPPPLAVR